MLILAFAAFVWGWLMGALTNFDRGLANTGHSLGKTLVSVASLAWTVSAIFSDQLQNKDVNC
jgi:hypothetical protein